MLRGTLHRARRVLHEGRETLGDRQRLDLPRGARSYETRGWISDLRYSPAGDAIAFIEHPAREDETGVVVVFDPVRGEKKALTTGGAPRRDLLGLAWRPDGRELWFGEPGALRAVTLNGQERVVAQLPESVHVHDIAPDGRVLLSHESRRMQISARAPGADRERDLSWLTWSVAFAVTPDGRAVVFTEFEQQTGFKGIAAMRGTDASPVVRLGEPLLLPGGEGRFARPAGREGNAVGPAEEQRLTEPFACGHRLIPSLVAKPLLRAGPPGSSSFPSSVLPDNPGLIPHQREWQAGACKAASRSRSFATRSVRGLTLQRYFPGR
jgi:hypothetical protein